MSAPSFILEAETATYDATTPKTTAGFNVLSLDVIVVYALDESNSALTISNSGTALAWTQQQVIAVAGFCWVSIWTHVVSQSRAAVTVSLASGGAGNFGGDALLFRGSDGVGASSKANVATAAPTLNLTTTAANSTIVVANADFTAGTGARTWRTGAGALTETTFANVAAAYTVYGGYHADAGPIGTYAVGLTAPSQTYSIAAVEIKSSVPGSVLMPRMMRMRW